MISNGDGRIQIAGHEGRMSADVNYFTRDFGYTVPTDGTEVEVTIVGTFQGTKVYVNGELVSFLSQKQDQDGLSGVTSLYSSVLLPLQKIGQDFSGALADIRVYNKALSAEEVKAAFEGTDDGKVNVAQNTYSGSDSYQTGDAFDDSEQRTRTSAKAIDGDAFVTKADKTAQPDTATSDIYSYWRGDHQDSALTIDLGETREISEIGIQWRYGGKGRDFDILTSMDGENWTTAREVRGNGDFFQTIVLDSPVTARYVKMQGIQSNASIYMIQEFMVYEIVDKAQLTALLAEAESLTDLDARQTVLFARAMLESPLATVREIAAAEAALAQALEAYKPAVSFVDVTEDDYYFNAVAWAVRKGITSGTSETTFSPDDQCTRGQVVTFLWAAAGKPEPETTDNPFVDVSSGDYYYKAVLWAAEKGITAGMDADHFGPGSACTRSQVVTFLYSAFGKPSVAGVENPFSDVSAEQWYAAPILWAVKEGITSGIGDGLFGVDHICSRAQIVTFLYKAYN